ncbi:MAG: serine/threonine-protein kinase, partial [Anaerolineales bacterium]|nr:serine/threonine-protein kinase [Anaerolineales bacterium]
MPLQLNDTLHGRYRIEGQLGKGGMGAVFLAHDLTLAIKVAVKENLNPSPESERQFRREARLLATLRHPNLPRVTDHFILDDRQYLVMDFVEGVDLHTQVEKQPPTPDEVLTWAESICGALSYLHARKPPVIHRDIKPANLKLQPGGKIVLVDFGIAKVFDQSRTTTGARGLTPGFSPPEQYGGQRTDARSDQYSLAATLYSFLTNQRPADSIQRMLGKEILQPVRNLNPAVPEHMEAALERALALKQEDRFADIANFCTALAGRMQLETIRAPLKPPAPPKSRNVRLWVGLGVLALILIGGGAALALGGNFPFGGGRAQPTETAVVAVVQPENTEPPSTPTPIPFTPTPIPEPSSTPTLTPTATATTVILGGGGKIAFVSDREDGRTLQIWTMNADGSDPRQLTYGPGDKGQPRWSTDGTKITYSAPGGSDAYGNDLGLDIFVINADRSGETINLTESLGDDFDPTWSPDGSQIAFTSTRVNALKQVFVMGVECLPAPDSCSITEPPQNITAGYAIEDAPAWSPDGQTLAVIASINRAPGRIILRPAEGGDPSWFDLQDRIIGADHLTWSSDGQFIAFSWLVKYGKQEIYIAYVQSPGLDPISLTNSLGNKEPMFSPNNQLIVFTSTRDQNPEIYIMTNNGSGQQNLTQ